MVFHRVAFFHTITGFAALTITFVSVFALPLCRVFNGENGCGISLDDSQKYSLASDDSASTKWSYPGYIADQERLVRRWFLFGLTLFEADFGRRMFISTLCGTIIGFERRQADRPAGIRTMSLAAMGACLFTICGTFAFMNGPNTWDASRISAALPSGVGFLGAGIIWKGQLPGTTRHTVQVNLVELFHSVRGLTTAAGVWISAAAGCACGGGLYFAGIYGSLLSVSILRYGPRLYLHPDDSESDVDSDDDIPSDGSIVSRHNYGSIHSGGDKKLMEPINISRVNLVPKSSSKPHPFQQGKRFQQELFSEFFSTLSPPSFVSPLF